jgi:hypothetical protein
MHPDQKLLGQTGELLRPLASLASATGICANQPCYIRNFTLLFRADGKNAPCSAKIGVAHKLLKKLVNFIAKNRLSLQFLKISLQIANCREERPRDLFASDCILRHAVGLCGVISDRANATRHHRRPRLGTRQFVGVDV